MTARLTGGKPGGTAGSSTTTAASYVCGTRGTVNFPGAVVTLEGVPMPTRAPETGSPKRFTTVPWTGEPIGPGRGGTIEPDVTAGFPPQAASVARRTSKTRCKAPPRKSRKRIVRPARRQASARLSRSPEARQNPSAAQRSSSIIGIPMPKIAITCASRSMETKQPIAPMQSPDQLMNCPSPRAEAASVTELPCGKFPTQVPGQSMAGGIDITRPGPLTLTESVRTPSDEASEAIGGPEDPQETARTAAVTAKATRMRMAAPFRRQQAAPPGTLWQVD